MMYFCEINKTHDEHLTINGKLFQLLRGLYPTHVIHCYMSLSHWNQLDGVIEGDSNVRFFETRVIEPMQGDKIRWIRKIVLECLTILKIVRKAAKQGVGLIFFSSMSPFANYFIQVLLKYFVTKDVKVIVTLHGELQLLKSTNQKMVDKLYAACLRKALRVNLSNRRFLVLNELIKGNLVKNGIAEHSAILEIPHPYGKRYEIPLKRDANRQGKTVLGHIGTAKLVKNSHLFFDLADKNAKNVKSGCAVFLISGQVFGEMRPFQNAYVEFGQTSSFVEAAAYVERCLMMDYAIFMYTDDQYGMISSGAIMDAIAFGIPIIGFKNTYLTYLFNLCHAKPGVLCEGYEDMADCVRRLIESDDGCYPHYLAGMKELQTYFSFERIQRQFNVQVGHFFG